jgi:hypothetical protein
MLFSGMTHHVIRFKITNISKGVASPLEYKSSTSLIEDGFGNFRRNVCNFVSNSTALRIRRQYLSQSSAKGIFQRHSSANGIPHSHSGTNNISHSYSGVKVSDLQVWTRTGVLGTSHPDSVNRHRLVVL